MHKIHDMNSVTSCITTSASRLIPPVTTLYIVFTNKLHVSAMVALPIIDLSVWICSQNDIKILLLPAVVGVHHEDVTTGLKQVVRLGLERPQ